MFGEAFNRTSRPEDGNKNLVWSRSLSDSTAKCGVNGLQRPNQEASKAGAKPFDSQTATW